MLRLGVTGVTVNDCRELCMWLLPLMLVPICKLAACTPEESPDEKKTQRQMPITTSDTQSSMDSEAGGTPGTYLSQSDPCRLPADDPWLNATFVRYGDGATFLPYDELRDQMLADLTAGRDEGFRLCTGQCHGEDVLYLQKAYGNGAECFYFAGDTRQFVAVYLFSDLMSPCGEWYWPCAIILDPSRCRQTEVLYESERFREAREAIEAIEKAQPE